MLRYLQHVAVLDPRQVLAGVVAQLPDSHSHVLMLPHVLSQTHQCCVGLPPMLAQWDQPASGNLTVKQLPRHVGRHRGQLRRRHSHTRGVGCL
jgi:hypothetical protein